MTAPGTGTATRTAPITMIDVRHLMWRIEADLRILRAQHSMISTEREESIMSDLIAFVYRNYVDQIEFRFVSDSYGHAVHRVRYALTRNWSGDDDDDSGGLRFVDLRGSSFAVIVSYASGWTSLSPDARAGFLQALRCFWGPIANVPDGPGYWTNSDRTYGSGGLGAVRSVFRSY